MGLARDLEQDISEAVVVIDALGAVCQKTEPHDLQTFADIFAEQFERDGQKFKSAVATSHRLEELDRIYFQPLAEAVRYPDIVADRVQTLFRQARVLIVEVRLSDYGPVQLGDESDHLRQAVQGFEWFLRARLEEARRVNSGKIVRLNLK